MAGNEVQLNPQQLIQLAAERSHLRWSRYAFRWTEKRKLLVAPHIEIIASVFDDILAGRRKRVLLNIAPRHGKAVACDTPMLTRLGWKVATDVTVGDQLLTHDGTWTVVTGVFPQGFTSAFRVVFDDASELITSADHRWAVLSAHHRAARSARWTPKQGLSGPARKPWQVKTTDELIGDTRTSCAERRLKWGIPAMLPLNGDTAEDEAYLIGYWLGDGSTQSAAITTMDAEVVDAFARFYELREHSHQNSGKALTYQVVGGFQSRLRAFGLQRGKTIPLLVLDWTVDARKALIRGFMDADGGNTNNGAEITQKSEMLIDELALVIRSVGWRARKTRKYSDVYARYYYTLGVSSDEAPYRLPRKIVSWRKPRAATTYRMIETIERVTDRETVCFSVAHPDHLFCAGKDLVVTHNTELGVKSLSSRIYARNPNARIMHTSYSDELVQKNSRNVKAVLTTEPFKQAFPNTRMAPDSFAKKHWNTTEGGEFHAVSTSSAVTGFECGMNGDPFDGMLIVDDPEKASGMSSAPYRSQMKDVVGQTISTRLNHDDTPVLVIQQRTHPDDVSNWLMSGGTGDTWDVLCFAAISDTGRPPEHYYEYSHANIIDYQIHEGALWPARKPLEALERIRDAQEDMDADEPRGKRVFASQYQQNPSDVSVSLYEEDWLQPYAPKDLPWSLDRITLRIDTAEKAGKKNDHTGMVTFGADKRAKDVIYILDVDRKRDEFPELVEWIVAHCKRLWLMQTLTLKFTQITIEDANIATALAAVLRPRLRLEGVYVRVELTKKYGSKFERALEAVPYFQQGRVLVPTERSPYMHPVRKGETEMEGIKVFREEFKTFNESDTHVSDDTLDPVVWEVVSRWGQHKSNSRFA